MMSYNLAGVNDLDSIRQLLMTNNLPYSDLNESPVIFLVARNGDNIVGCIGLEKYGNDGLLRSFAVIPDLQNQGIGKELYKNFLEFTRKSKITRLHLLTNTAKEYFIRIGYSVSNRNNAPEEISASSEFAGLCPDSSTYMVLDSVY